MASFTPSSIALHLTPRNFQSGKKMDVGGCQVGAVGQTVKVFPTKYLQQLLSFLSVVVAMKQRDGHPYALHCAHVLPPLSK
jgi:hypothetical protein